MKIKTYIKLGIVLCISLFLASSVRSEIKINEKALDIAKSYNYVRELNNDNRSPEIDKWHKTFGLPYGNPYCAMFTLNSYIEAFEGCHMKTPLPKIARVSTFSQWSLSHPLIIQTITTKQVIFGAYKPEIGDIISWKHGAFSPGKDNFGWNGHMGITNSWDGKKLFTVEGNTKPSNKGDQTGRVKEDPKLVGNDGVYQRERSLGQGTSFPIVYFHRLKKRIF